MPVQAKHIPQRKNIFLRLVNLSCMMGAKLRDIVIPANSKTTVYLVVCQFEFSHEGTKAQSIICESFVPWWLCGIAIGKFQNETQPYIYSIVTTAMLDPLFDHLQTIYPLSVELKAWLSHTLKIQTFPKKTVLLRDGQRADYLYVVLKGLLRSYYIKEDQEVCSRFMKENHIVISINSFYARKAGYEFIETMEDSVVASIHYNELQVLYKEFIEFNYIARILTEHYFSLSEERLYLLRKQKAEERYLFFLENYADLMDRVPLQYIATFLGMNLETLSRIRNKLRKA
jgi:CRP/FNR family transcriptional regulator, anaerobic regulatory protein